MKVIDIIFALVCGRIVGFLIGDFLQEWGIHLGLYYTLLLWILLPFLALFCLWVASVIGRKMLFVFQAAKHLLIGAAATVLDLKLFEGLALVLAIVIPSSWIVSKSISFLAATVVKYWGNKYWAFAKHEQEDLYKELLHFFFITLLGLLLDVGIFYYCTRIMGPQLGLTPVVWVKVSVILAALIAALWNFLGYKLLVFKK